MQLVTESAPVVSAASLALNETPAAQEARYAQYKTIRRNGSVVGFEPSKISIAMTKAFLAVNGGQGAASARVREQVEALTESVVAALMRRQPSGGTFHIEDIQDQVELALMRAGEHNVARGYVLYREQRAKERQAQSKDKRAQTQQPVLNVKEGGHLKPLDFAKITALVREACEGLGRDVSAEPIMQAMQRILYDRYFLHVRGRRIELPQVFYMRVAMGLALNEAEDQREARAIEFYNVLSSFDFMSSTPTLFNSGTRRSQLASCYLTTVADDLDGIYEAIKENALLQKFAGGIGNDWTPVRALGSHIKGTNGKSQGVVPFLKVVNDTAVAVNQGGKRKGAVCSYLETWHLDIEEFLELRKNTGDDRRRTHDMNTANWIPDLFMKRVMENAEWTLFSPSDVRELHDRFGKSFEEAYLRYEDKAARGELKLFKKVPAVQLGRQMLSMLFETGHP